jgi:nicotinate-nucleotide adenylyltransferase
MKLGIFGGSFNPPHIAHCILTEYLLEYLGLEKIVIVPSHISPHKIDTDILSAEKRFELAHLAFTGNPRVEVSRIEIDRGGKSYTIDTLRDFLRIYSSPQLFFIMGVDNLIGFNTWKEYQAILDICTVVAMNRPGFRTEDIESEIIGNVTIVSVPHLEISSTDIRERIRKRQSVKYLLPELVERKIQEEGYYLS